MNSQPLSVDKSIAVNVAAVRHGQALAEHIAPNFLVVAEECRCQPLPIIDYGRWNELWILEHDRDQLFIAFVLQIQDALIKPLGFFVRLDLTQIFFYLLVGVFTEHDKIFF